MHIFIVGLHIVLCFFLILVVLLQPGKGADFGAAMGGSSQEAFGATGSVTLLTKLTAIVAALFMITSLSLAWFSNTTSGGDSALDLENLTGAAAETGEAIDDAAQPVVEPGADTETEEPAAETDAGEAVPETDAGEAVPETDAGEAVPETDAGEAAPETDAGEAAPETDAGEAAPEEAPVEGAPAEEAPAPE